MTTQVAGSAYVATKTPAEFDDWQIDWAARGLGTDTISASSWAVAAASDGATADLVIPSNPAPSTTATTTTAWLSGGVAGNQYLVTNTVTTAGGRTLEESFVVDCIPERLIGT